MPKSARQSGGERIAVVECPIVKHPDLHFHYPNALARGLHIRQWDLRHQKGNCVKERSYERRTDSQGRRDGEQQRA